MAQSSSDFSAVDLRVTLAGSPGPIYAVAFSPNGQLTATGGADGTVRIWNVASGQEIMKFTGHTSSVWNVVFSPDGRTLATGGSDATTRIWNVASGQEIMKFTGYQSVAFSPDGRTLATGGGDSTARLWNVSSGQEIMKFTGHTSGVWSVAFSPDGRTLATGSFDNTARLWNVSSGQEIMKFTGHTNRVSSVAFSPDGRTLATGSFDNTVRLWNVSSSQEIMKFTGTDGVWSAVFSPDGRTLATSGYGGTTRLWNVSSGQETMRYTGHTSTVFSVAFSPDGRTLATGSLDNTARLWNVSSGQEIVKLAGHTSPTNSVAFSPDGRTLATGSWENTARLWNVSSGQEIMKLSPANSVVFSPDGRTLATGSWENTARLWNVSSGQEIVKFTGHTSPVSSIAFSPDGRTLATGSGDNTARLWNVSNGQEIMKFTGHTRLVGSIAFSPDGRTLATGSWDATARLWNVSSGQEIIKLTGHTSYVISVAFSPDGRTLATGSLDNTARLWNVSSGQEIMKLTGHTGWVNSVVFSPDSRTLATGSGDNTTRLWNVSSGQEIRRLTGNIGIIYSVAFSPDGTRVATGSIDTARIYSTPDLLPVFDVSKLPQVGDLSITAPGGSSIRINNQAGSSTQRLPSGSYTVTITQDGYKPFTQTVTVTTGQTTRVTAILEPLPQNLTISTNTPNATIAQNGQTLGRTDSSGNLTLPNLKPDTYNLTITATGFNPQTISVILPIGSPATARVTLQASTGTLNIRSNNETANITINSDARGFTGATRDFALPVGTYTVIVSASGFATSTQTITIRSDTRAELIFNLEPLPQMLRVVTGIPNATVSLNGRDIGTTDVNGNLEIPNLAPNTYQVSVTATGYKPNTQTATVPIGSRGTVIIPLEKALADVTISSNANNATVTIASRVIGLAPAKVSNLEPGTYSVTVSASGYEPSTQSITVKAGDSSSITVNLKALPVDLRIVSNASNAQVSINGATPKDIPKDGLVLSLEPNQTYTVLVTAVGYNQNKQSVTLEPNKPIRLQVDLKAQPSSLLIRSTPSGATVSRSGVTIGSTLLNLRDLEPGVYSFTVTAPNFEPQTVQVTVVAGQNQRVDVTLKPVVQVAAPVRPVSSPPTTPITTAPVSTTPLVSTSSTPTPIKPREDIFALVIGINDYQNSGIPDLKTAELDAKRFAAALSNPKIGNVNPNSIKLLLGAEASKNNLDGEYTDALERLQATQTLVVYFAGHGAPTPDGKALMLPWDANPAATRLERSSLVLSAWTEQAKGKRVLLILDSCFSGQQGTRSLTADATRPVGVQIVPAVVTGGVAVWSATSQNQSSQENTTGGLFTTAILEGLGGKADTNNDGVVSLEEAAVYTQRVVSGQTRNAQVPSVTGSSLNALAVAQNSEVVARNSVDARVAKIRALYNANKITIDQTEQLINLIRASNEFADLKAFLDGSLLEQSFLNRTQEGLYARFGVSGGRP